MSEGPRATLCNTIAHTSAPTRQIIELAIRQPLPSHSMANESTWRFHTKMSCCIWFWKQRPQKSEQFHHKRVLRALLRANSNVWLRKQANECRTIMCIYSRHISGFFYSRQKRFYEWNVWCAQALSLGNLATKWRLWSQFVTLAKVLTNLKIKVLLSLKSHKCIIR